MPVKGNTHAYLSSLIQSFNVYVPILSGMYSLE